MFTDLPEWQGYANACRGRPKMLRLDGGKRRSTISDSNLQLFRADNRLPVRKSRHHKASFLRTLSGSS